MNVDLFFMKFIELPIDTQINIFWALLKPDERFHIVSYHMLYMD